MVIPSQSNCEYKISCVGFTGLLSVMTKGEFVGGVAIFGRARLGREVNGTKKIFCLVFGHLMTDLACLSYLPVPVPCLLPSVYLGICLALASIIARGVKLERHAFPLSFC